MANHVNSQKTIRITYPNTDFADVVSIEFYILKPVSLMVDLVTATIASVINRQATYATTQDYFDEPGTYKIHPWFTYNDGFKRYGKVTDFKIGNQFQKMD